RRIAQHGAAIDRTARRGRPRRDLGFSAGGGCGTIGAELVSAAFAVVAHWGNLDVLVFLSGDSSQGSAATGRISVAPAGGRAVDARATRSFRVFGPADGSQGTRLPPSPSA